LIKIKDISLSLGPEKPPLTAQNIYIDKGLYALIGRNGAGKSTLLKALIGLTPIKGEGIEIQHKNIQTYSSKALAKTVSIVFSKSTVFGNHTALDVLHLGRVPHQNLMGKLSLNDHQIVKEVSNLLNLNALWYKPYNVLSDGEKQLVMIGRALVQETPIILLDEPTAFLDLVNRKKIIATLHHISRQQNRLIIFSSHNLDLVQNYCDGMLIISNHQVKQINQKSEFNTTINQLFADEI
jgi:iron complex transport system ATP-binding protein